MTDINRLSILISKADEKYIRKLQSIFKDEKITVLEQPEIGVIMATAYDSFGTKFCLGEILVTKATVEYDGLIAHGIIIGDAPDKALILATINVLMLSKNERLKKRIYKTLSLMKNNTEKKEKIERSLIMKTKVNFHTMAKR